MITKIFNAKAYFNKIINRLSKKSKHLFYNYNKKPCLTIFTLTNNFSTNLYIKNKIITCIKTNIELLIFKFNKNIKIKSLIFLIKITNKNKKINAILIQMPIPNNINKKKLCNKINPNKDIDMLNSKNFGSHIMGYNKNIQSCTSQAILILLKLINIKITNLKITIFGFSNIVGKPLLFDLFSAGATVTSINKSDKNYNKSIKSTDIIITAIGKPNFLSKHDIKYGNIIIDIGINKLNNNIITGDTKINYFINKSKYITPVPGGIGLLTISCLLSNIIKLYLQQNKKGLF